MSWRRAKLRRTMVLPSIYFLAVLTAVSACADPQAGGRAPTELAPRAAESAVSTYSLTVTVTQATGSQGVPGLTVVPFNTESGPFTASGGFAIATTDANGVAKIDGLPAGAYCVTVRQVPNSVFTYPNRVAPPMNDASDSPAVPASGATVGLITGKSLKPVPFTLGAFQTYCQSAAAPINLQKNTSIKLSLLGSKDVTPASVSWTLLDLNGEQVFPAAFTAIELPDTTPWFKSQSGLPSDVVPALLVATTASQSSSAVGLAAGQAVSIQTTLLRPSDEQGRITATLGTVAGVDGGVVYMQPLVCKVVKGPEPSGDNNGGLDLVGVTPESPPQVKMGISADQALGLDDRRMALWYVQKGTGSASLNLRFVGGDVANLHYDYACDAAGTVNVCTGTQGGPASPVVAKVFGTRLGDGSVRVALVVKGIRDGVTAVDVQLSTTGDQFPDASRSGQVAGFFRLEVPDPTSCDAGFGSDDRFWVN